MGASEQKNAKLSALRKELRLVSTPPQEQKEIKENSISFISLMTAGSLHEVTGPGYDCEEASLPTFFALFLHRQWQGKIAWLSIKDDLYGPGLVSLGLRADDILFLQPGNNQESLWATEEILRHGGGLETIIAEIGPLSLTASRRLQLAAEKSGIRILILRRFRLGAMAQAAKKQPIAAITRWHISPLPSLNGHRHAMLDLWRHRGGLPRSWHIQFQNYQEGNHAISLSVASSFPDRLLARKNRHA